MRKEYRRAVRRLFSERLAEPGLGFGEVKVRSPLLFGGESVFQRVLAAGRLGFILLVPDGKGRQAFTLEVGWSALNRFPEATMRPSVLLGPDDPDPLDLEEGIVRLGGLASRSDLWWSLPDPALERPGDLLALQRSLEPLAPETALEDARPPVTDALGVLAHHGIPFLQRWVATQPPG